MKNTPSWLAWFRHSAGVSLLPVGLAAAGCAISQQKEAEMGAQYANEINRQLPIMTDATVQRTINLIGQDIARHGHRGIDYKFFVVDAKQVNAFAVPGGYIYVNRGLIERAHNFPELAGVLAHEIGHVEERHSVEQMEKMQRANIGLTLAYVLLGRTPGGAERAAINVGGGLVFARYSREAENEADSVAIPLLLAARIQPKGLVTMFEKLLAEQRRSPSAVEQWFSTHPTTQNRIDAIRREIAAINPNELRWLRTSSRDFEALNNRLRQLPPPKDSR